MNLYAYVVNSAPNLIDPTGLLQVCCRDANLPPVKWYAAAALWPTPCHCFLKLSDGHVLGGYHQDHPPFDPMGFLVLRPDDPADVNKDAKCQDVKGLPCADDRARKAFNSSPKLLGGYGFAGSSAGTSNDAAAGLLRDAGIDFTLPACAWGKTVGVPPPPPWWWWPHPSSFF
jgi:hypothetical protein